MIRSTHHSVGDTDKLSIKGGNFYYYICVSSSQVSIPGLEFLS